MEERCDSSNLRQKKSLILVMNVLDGNTTHRKTFLLCYICRGYYPTAQRNEFYFRVVNTIFTNEHKPPSTFLFIL